MVNLMLLIAGFVLMLLAGFNTPSSRVSLGWLGAACIALTFILSNWPK